MRAFSQPDDFLDGRLGEATDGWTFKKDRLDRLFSILFNDSVAARMAHKKN